MKKVFVGAFFTTMLFASSLMAQNNTNQTGSVKYVKKPRYGMVSAGAAIFGASYFSAVTAATLLEYPTNKWMYIPFVGPFANLGACSADPFCRITGVNQFLVAFDGTLQIVGFITFVTGFAAKKFVPQKHVSVNIVPSYNGASIVGTF